ncbi:MAG: MarR family transcriptional regulator [Catenulisporales bacterium]|nr:MarR family transcriptional regulator [Catenulisporales bacterium]
MAARNPEAIHAFIDAVEAIGLHVARPTVIDEAVEALGLNSAWSKATDNGTADVVLDLDGRRVPVEIKYRATLMPLDVPRLKYKSTAPGGLRVLIADRIAASTRETLNSQGVGWLDLRGRLRIAGSGVFVDTDVPAMATRFERVDAFSGTAGVEVACSLLLHPDRPPKVRELARELGRSPSTVSEILKRLREQRLIDSDGHPMIPDLFWETVQPWETRPIAIAQYPHPTGDSRFAGALQLGLGDLESPGWALTDTLAAVEYGAPLAAGSAYPADFYVPTSAVVKRAVQVFGEASEWNSRRATVRVAPISAVCDARVESTGTWPLAQPLFVALDLASDPERGREVLDGWTPPSPWRRVW